MSSWYQYIAGEKKGSIEVFSHEEESNGEKYIVFLNGDKVKKSDEGKLVKGINSLDDIAFDEQGEKINENKNMKDLQYPTAEELEHFRQGDGYSLGAGAVSSDVPSDDMIYPKAPIIQHASANNDMMKGLEFDDAPTQAPRQTVTDSFSNVSKEDASKMKARPKDADPIDQSMIFIDFAKKEEIKVELSFSTKIPVQNIFQTMDPSFVKKNANKIIDYLVKGIKTSDLEKQLKEKIRKYYGL